MPIALSPLYAIVDVEVCAVRGWEPRDLTRAYLAGGARLLQLRAKTLPGGIFLQLAEAISEDAARAGAILVVNDRPDIARLVGPGHVHVGQDDLSPADVRRITGPDAIVGLSTHTVDQIDAALRAPISYLAIGPTYVTATKTTGYSAVGLEAVAEAARRAGPTGRPVVAIGGITLETAPAVLAAGAAAVAVITDLVSDNPEQRVRQYLAALA